MSNFWIQIAENGMPANAQKAEFCPTIGWGWENFGKRGELADLQAKVAKLEDHKKKLRETLEVLSEDMITNNRPKTAAAICNLLRVTK